MGDKKSRQILRRAKTINPNSIVCAIGCYAQVAQEELNKIEDIDLVLGTIEKNQTFDYVNDLITKKYSEKISKVNNIMQKTEYCEFNGIAFSEHVRAEIKIQDGCDRFCSYCIIPYARGPVRSRKKENIINEIKELSKKGIKEIVITGIHISSYGKDFSSNKSDENYKYEYGLIDLLEEINKIDGVERIRLGSLEPRIITEEFVSRLIKLSKVCNHFHLSLQSGCDDTLKRMNRKYTTDEFLNISEILRKNIPNVALTTDVIVGFPGESENEFENTFEFLKKIKFSKMHIFKYSKRKGTPAAIFKNQVPNEEKEKRSKILIDLSDKNEEDFASTFLDKKIDVLFENEKEGHTTNYIKVVLNKKGNNIEVTNKIMTVIAKEYKNGELIAELI